MTMEKLDPLSLPLNQSVLIEASAGTGKTYTMVNLYLRLILGVGCPPLSPEQILVVTFTKAATQELRDRIRAKLGRVANIFQNIDDEKNQALLNEDDVLQQLYQAVKNDLNAARLRLKIAEREMDLAAIYTIDSFCQKMLFQYAFDSGMRFDIDLQPDERELLIRLSEVSWRELFYSLSLEESDLVRTHLKTPEEALGIAQHYLSGALPHFSETQQTVLQRNVAEFRKEKRLTLQQLKQFWKEHSTEIRALILNELEKKYPPKVPKSLKRQSYTVTRTEKYLAELNQWADEDELTLPNTWERFTQSFITDKKEEGAEPLYSPLFVQAEQLAQHYHQHFSEQQAYNILIFRFLTHLREKLSAYKQSHREKSFNDITDFLHSALMGENGDRFAQAIRHQLRFAMIDEFQDTNRQQYEIFHRIFMQNVEQQGFVMIGDPKQSIYKFRHADIFAYLNAANHVNLKVTMDKNWRSVPAIVEDINQLFLFPKDDYSPFIYTGIQFQAVFASDPDTHIVGETPSNCYLIPDFKQELAAKYCAYRIQQQLKQAENGELFLQKNGEKQPLKPKDITILVRGKSEAKAIKQALGERHIRAIYLSARDSVYESQEALDLLLILQACINPFSQRAVLAALGSILWGLDAASLYQLKNDEKCWDSYVEKFMLYKSIWQKQGILPMLHRLFLKEQIIERLNHQENAERRITDLLHLAELLQEAMIEHQTEAALLQWYQQQLHDPNGQIDEQKLRLESELELIKIVTIHGSKGLEYPVVWLPFIAQMSQPFSETGAFGKKHTPITYHDQNGEVCWAFSPISKQEKYQLTQEEFAEELRLLYVAVTRAKHQLNFILPENFEKGWNCVSYLLSNGEIELLDNTTTVETKTALQAKALQCEVIEYQEPIGDEWQAKSTPIKDIQASIFHGTIQEKRQITSFTALHRMHERLQNVSVTPLAIIDDALDHDDMPSDSFINEHSEHLTHDDSPHHFPQGKQVGIALHKLFEMWDFNQPLSPNEIQEYVCKPLNLHHDWIPFLQRWLANVINTPFAEQLTLTKVHKHKRLNEWQFYLRLSNEQALPQLNALLKAESDLAKDLPDLQLKQLEGFVKGVIDMIIEIDGKFYIIDYKSNYLGNTLSAYSSSKLEKAMGQHRYDLQYLLYTLALHRYLRSRWGEKYHYEQHFGGVAYLFLRGMNGEKDSGVFFDKPSKKLIAEMDKLFQ